MKFKKLLPLLMVLPLSGCVNPKKGPIQKDPLVIPNVDVDNLKISLPALPEYNTTNVKTDDTYAYLDFYEVSDFHGAVDYKESDTNAYIGLKKLATYLNNKREDNKGGTIVLSSGDMFQGSADSNSTRGYVVNYAMHYMGFEAMAVGNHEFDWTDEWLKKNSELKYGTNQIPYLGINIKDKRTNQIPDFVQKSTIIERGNSETGKYKIGVIGAIGSELESSILQSCISNYDFSSEAELISQEAARLKNDEKCDVVVLLEHQGVDKIPDVTGVDAIFGGHAHENKVGNQGSVPVVATKNYGRGIAHISLKINKNTKAVTAEKSEVFAPTNTDCLALADDQGIGAIINEFVPSINSIKNIELGTATGDLLYNEALKNICTQTMFDVATDFAKTQETIDESKIIAAFHNVNGGIRSDIGAGKITYGSVFSAFPFDNEIVLLKAKGTLLKNKLKNFTQLGVCRTFDSATDISANEMYYIVTTDFLALSDTFFNGTNFKTLTEADLAKTGYVVRDVVAEKLYTLDTVKPEDFSNSMAKYKGIPLTF